MREMRVKVGDGFGRFAQGQSTVDRVEDLAVVGSDAVCGLGAQGKGEDVVFEGSGAIETPGTIGERLSEVGFGGAVG